MARYILLAAITLLLAFMMIVLTSTVAISKTGYIYQAGSFQYNIDPSCLFEGYNPSC